jgi:hypothetical protein
MMANPKQAHEKVDRLFRPEQLQFFDLERLLVDRAIPPYGHAL